MSNKVIADQDILGELERYRAISKTRQALLIEVNECHTRFRNFDATVWFGGECQQKIANYNGLVDQENTLEESVKFKQQFVLNQLKIIRMQYAECQ